MNWEDQLQEGLEQRIGHRVREGASGAPARRFVMQRAEARGLSPSEMVQRLLTEPDEYNALLGVATTGFTYLFRARSQLDTLVGQLGALNRPVHVWCAACSTGEEVMSLAMLFAEKGVVGTILGTDVNPEAIATARTGCITSRATERVPVALKHLLTAQGSHHRVVPAVRKLFTFEVHNLVGDVAPMAPGGVGWDAVLFRNALIYFTDAANQIACQRIGRALRPDGVLIAAPAEQVSAPFRAVFLGEEVVWRLPGKTADAAPVPPVRMPRAKAVPKRRMPPAPHPAVSRPAPDLARLLTQANRAMASHEFDEAHRRYSEALALDPLNPETHHLLGTLYRKEGDLVRARASLRGALFLMPDFWPAASMLAGVLDRLGDRAGAARLRRQATQLAVTVPASNLFRSEGWQPYCPSP